MSADDTPSGAPIEQCIAVMSVCVGTSDPLTVAACQGAIDALIAGVPESSVERTLTLLHLYNRFSDLKLSGSTADTIKRVIETEMYRVQPFDYRN